MRNTVIVIGEKIREFRMAKNIKLFEAAGKADISKGLLSKIENGRAIPSLPVLLQILKSLEVDLSDFFSQVESESDLPLYFLIKKSEYVPINKEEAVGYQYFAVFQRAFSSIVVNFTYLELMPDAKRALVTTEGFEFIFLIEGKIDYVLGNELLTMEAGDSLFFNGNIPHVKKNPYGQIAKILVVYLLTTITN
jgi:transcriptional regulator with XRE-family HTH domain